MTAKHEQRCRCPFCDQELAFSCFEPVFCKGCNIALVACGGCGKLFNEAMDQCPHCGAKNTRPQAQGEGR